jgi:hypothetical protein
MVMPIAATELLLAVNNGILWFRDRFREGLEDARARKWQDHDIYAAALGRFDHPVLSDAQCSVFRERTLKLVQAEEGIGRWKVAGS